MNLELNHVFRVSREQLWNLLLDPASLAHCIPGCAELQEVDPDLYTAIMKVGVASIKGTYTGRVEIAEKQFPAHYKLSVEGEAGQSFLRGLATIDLAEQGDGETRLSLKSEVLVGGLLASVGQRFLSGIARQMAGTFFRNIEKELLAGDPAGQTAERLAE